MPKGLTTRTQQTTRSGIIGVDVTRLEFITTIKPACIAVEKESGIPYGWLIAQAIQESGGYGNSDLAMNAYNLYGIKGTDYYQGKTGYAKFNSWADAIHYQGWQLNVDRYVKYKYLVVAGRYREYGDAIQNAGWCAPSKPTYGEMISSIATTYKLFPAPAPKLSVAQQWAIDNKIIDVPVDWGKPVDYNVMAWLLYKARGKV